MAGWQYPLNEFILSFLDLKASKDGELIIEIPQSVKLSLLNRGTYMSLLNRLNQEEQSRESKESSSSKDHIVIEQYSNMDEADSLRSVPGFKLPVSDHKVWSGVYQHNPLEIQIRYTLKNPEVGILFRNDPTPHVYSWSSFFSGKQEESLCNGVRTWVPCIDNELERCLWELEIIVPSTFSVWASGKLVKKTLYDNVVCAQ